MLDEMPGEGWAVMDGWMGLGVPSLKISSLPHFLLCMLTIYCPPFLASADIHGTPTLLGPGDDARGQSERHLRASGAHLLGRWGQRANRRENVPCCWTQLHVEKIQAGKGMGNWEVAMILNNVLKSGLTGKVLLDSALEGDGRQLDVCGRALWAGGSAGAEALGQESTGHV